MQMSTLILLECAGMSFGCALFHLLIKLDTKAKTAKAAKEPFSPKEYFYDERFAIAANIVAQTVILCYTPELIAKYPALEGWVLAINGLAGFAGSSLLSKVLGQANKKADKIIDSKTNSQ